jgi:hypothetical protein
MIPVWQKRRAAFNHDWLKNRYITNLDGWLNLLDNKFKDSDFERTFILSILPEWHQHLPECLSLIHEFSLEMSPRVLFRHPPLVRCDVATKQWLGDFLHQRWLARHPISEWTSTAHKCAQMTDKSYGEIQEQLRSCEDIHSANKLQPMRRYFVEFRERCQDLANAVEKFPRTILIG